METNKMMDKPLCDRIIRPSSKEKKKDYKKFWLRLFEALEHDAAIPFHKRFSILSTMFKSMKGILTGVYKLEKQKTPALLKKFFLDQIEKPVTEETELPWKKVKSHIGTSEEAILGDDEVFQILEAPVGLKTLKSFTKSVEQEAEDASKRIGSVNPYTNFFNLAKINRAAIWRQLPKSSYTHLEIEEKVVAVVEYVADQFVNWALQMWDLTDQRDIYIDAVKKMFNVEIGMHAATSLQLRVKQMTSIPDTVAKERNNFHLSEKSSLRQQLRRDIEWCLENENNPEERLCNKKRYAQLRQQITNKWMKCVKYPQKLITMATVWEGTSHLKSTRKFCEYLVDHPDIAPPQYLIDTGLLSKEFLKQQEESEAELHYVNESRVPSINIKMQQ